ncbi:MAG: SMP-30/gluconolactonase/LRE family protein, partial [Chitinophagaceae bacterium]
MYKCLRFNIASVFLFANLLLSSNSATSQQTMNTSIFLQGNTPKLISRQFSFTEGPAADEEGNVFFTDQPNNTIWKYDVDGKLHLFMDSAGRANGMYFDTQESLIACADEHNQLWRINKAGRVTVLLSGFMGKRFNGPNDVWVDPKGGLYFTDPYYQRSYWTRKAPELAGQDVYYLQKGRNEATVVIRGLKKPNGIIGTPDGKWLYVADIGDGKTYRYPIQENGNIGEGTLFAAMGSDGMTLDEQGNVYLTGQGITVFNSS